MEYLNNERVYTGTYCFILFYVIISLLLHEKQALIHSVLSLLQL